MVKLTSQAKAENNVLDPIKFILVLALRTGNLKASSIEEELSDTALRSGKTIQWLHSERPVLAPFSGRGLLLP